MPTWTCSGPTGCHLCHHLPEDVEDPADDAEDPGDGPKAFDGCGHLIKHFHIEHGHNVLKPTNLGGSMFLHLTCSWKP